LPEQTIRVRVQVNGSAMELAGHPMSRLLDAIRTQAHLTGTKEGCGEGECGACSILMNDRLVNSCLVPLAHAEGATITTIEGLAGDGQLHAIQAAFIEHGGAQCGICTPGMILAATDLLKKTPAPTLEEIRAGLSGNLCRCTGYMRIFESIVSVMRDTAR
jgi:carbon-monoxide dehydrogenase small subunit